MLESNLDLTHDVTLRAIAGWPQGRPIEIQRAMQQIITEQIGMFCTGLSSEEYFDDLLYFLKMMIQLNITKRLPKVMERLPKYQPRQAANGRVLRTDNGIASAGKAGGPAAGFY